MPLSRAALDRIARLRDLFLAADRGERALGDYWRDAVDLQAYDEVLAARIGWKWDAALSELAARGWPRAEGEVVLDYGCGSGIAGRRFAAHFGARELLCHDRSARAMQYAVARATALDVRVRALPALGDLEPDVLLVSHVLGELDARGLAELHRLIDRSARVVLVEPGSHAVSRRLSQLRDALCERFAVAAPCTHAAPCPALATPNDWCHFFAAPPPAVFTDGDWVKTARAVGFDLRALPYSWLALVRRDLAPAASPTAPAPARARVLGRPAPHPRGLRVQVCASDGLREVLVDKRGDPATYRALDKRPATVRYLPHDAPPAE